MEILNVAVSEESNCVRGVDHRVGGHTDHCPLGHRVIGRPLTAVRQFVEAASALARDYFRNYPEAHVRIVADGCSGYFLRVMTSTGTHVVRRRGRPLACRSLSEAKDVARRLRPLSVELEHRVAQDEMDGGAGFSRLRL